MQQCLILILCVSVRPPVYASPRLCTRDFLSFQVYTRTVKNDVVYMKSQFFLTDCDIVESKIELQLRSYV